MCFYSAIVQAFFKFVVDVTFYLAVVFGVVVVAFVVAAFGFSVVVDDDA